MFSSCFVFAIQLEQQRGAARRMFDAASARCLQQAEKRKDGCVVCAKEREASGSAQRLPHLGQKVTDAETRHLGVAEQDSVIQGRLAMNIFNTEEKKRNQLTFCYEYLRTNLGTLAG